MPQTFTEMVTVFISRNKSKTNLVNSCIWWEHSQHDNVAGFLDLLCIRPVVLVTGFWLLMAHFQSMMNASISYFVPSWLGLVRKPLNQEDSHPRSLTLLKFLITTRNV